MWILLTLLTLVPLFAGIARPSIRPVRIYLGLVIFLLIAVVPVNNILNATYDPAGYREGHAIVRVTPHRIQRLTGPLYWRYFSWGIFQGDGANTQFRFWLIDNLHVDYELAGKLDVTNPTPFAVLIWLLSLCGISLFVKLGREFEWGPHTFFIQGTKFLEKAETDEKTLSAPEGMSFVEVEFICANGREIISLSSLPFPGPCLTSGTGMEYKPQFSHSIHFGLPKPKTVYSLIFGPLPRDEGDYVFKIGERKIILKVAATI